MLKKSVLLALGVTGLAGTPGAALAQQLYECTWTLTTTTIRTTYRDGSVSIKIIQDKVEVCRPI